MRNTYRVNETGGKWNRPDGTVVDDTWHLQILLLLGIRYQHSTANLASLLWNPFPHHSQNYFESSIQTKASASSSLPGWPFLWPFSVDFKHHWSLSSSQNQKWQNNNNLTQHIKHKAKPNHCSPVTKPNIQLIHFSHNISNATTHVHNSSSQGTSATSLRYC